MLSVVPERPPKKERSRQGRESHDRSCNCTRCRPARAPRPAAPARRLARVGLLGRRARRRRADRRRSRGHGARRRGGLRRRAVRALRRQRHLPPLALEPALAPAAAPRRPQHDLRLHRRELHADRAARAARHDAARRAHRRLGRARSPACCSASPGSTRRAGSAPRRTSALGWVALLAMPQLARPRCRRGRSRCCSPAALLYSAGAVVYARQRPDPWPQTFGFHELFHAFVIAARGARRGDGGLGAARAGDRAVLLVCTPCRARHATPFDGVPSASGRLEGRRPAAPCLASGACSSGTTPLLQEPRRQGAAGRARRRYEERRYLEDPPTPAELDARAARARPRAVGDRADGRAVARELGLRELEHERARWLELMAANPILIERPILVTDDGRAALGRPPEAIEAVL